MNTITTIVDQETKKSALKTKGFFLL